MQKRLKNVIVFKNFVPLCLDNFLKYNFQFFHAPARIIYMYSKTILLVDDDASITSILEFILKQEGFNILIANNAKETMDIINSKAVIDLVFLDVKIPGIEGLELFKEIQKVRNNILIIMMTGYSVDNLLREAFDLGAYGVIYKPFDEDEIFSVIKQIFKSELTKEK